MNEELYENIKESLIRGLKEQADIEVINIDFDNIEIIVHKMDWKVIEDNGFSISFQKQNGSFTVITKDDLDENIKQQIVGIIDNFTQKEEFASYNFSDMMNFNINHYVYDDSKIDFNKNILNEFKKLNQIVNLKINDLKKNDGLLHK